MAATVEQPARITVLRMNQVQAVTGFGRSWLYQLMQEGKFPRARKIGARAVGWNSAEVYAWIEARMGEQA